MSSWLAICAILGIFASTTADLQFTILHTNDIHARIEEADKFGGPCTDELVASNECFGGVSRIRTMVNQKRTEFPGKTILLDAGDQFQGTLWFYQFGGIVMAQFMNLIIYNAMAIGNHEFDTGIDGLIPFAKNLTFPLLSSNINATSAPGLNKLIKKSTVVTIDGRKIGIVGYTTVETPYVSSPGNLTFYQELEPVQAEINKLTDQGINIIIALGHSGYAVDLALGEQLKNVDIIVGGHTNTFLYTGKSPSNEVPSGEYPTVVTNTHDGGQVLVVQDYAFGKYLGELHVTFDDKGKIKAWSGNPILLDKSVAKDTETEMKVSNYLPELNELKKTVIGQSYVDLLADRVVCRTTECNLGNLVTDAMIQFNLRHTTSEYWSDVAIAVVNAGSFRASISTGTITTEQVVFVQPFRNTVDIIEMTGQTLLEMFELCATKWIREPDEAFGGFLQVSGLQVTYDIRRPVGQRVVKVLAVCTKCKVPKLEPLKPKDLYKVIMSSYLSNGGDGFTMLPAGVVKRHNAGDLDTDILLKYVKQHSPLITRLEGRIQHLQDIENVNICSSSGARTLTWSGFALLTGITLFLTWVRL